MTRSNQKKKPKKWKPRRDRYDIYNNLPHGAMAQIADKLECSHTQVTMVLQGKRRDHQGIIREAERRAAEHVWKTRFCRFRSELRDEE